MDNYDVVDQDELDEDVLIEDELRCSANEDWDEIWDKELDEWDDDFD